ncbi:MAG: hypothetical protein KME29_03585 [Calothrix sp. FI2-JRJ7]|jgi:hypothetical protein|nr:hypothetical protein [Calothrix sp. FI2-JRJ7]
MKLGVLALLLLISFAYKDIRLTDYANQTLISCTTSEPPPQKNSGGNKDT